MGDFGTTEQDIKKHCKGAGPVSSIEMYGKGAAVVTFGSPTAANNAVKLLDHTTIGSNTRYIDVKINDETKGGNKRSAPEGPSCRVYVRGFDFVTTDEQFESHMSA